MPERHGPTVPRALAIVAAGGLLVAGVPPGQPASSLRDVLARASAWIADYGSALSTVIADERYVQTSNDGRGHPQSRVLESEFALVRVADREEWIAFRDVVAVDGVRVRDRGDRLERLFLDRPEGALALARAIADESARYNLGPVVRNFNVPTAALFFLHPANRDRFSFRKASEIRRADELLWQVDYAERARPTLIRTPDGRSIPTHGTFQIEPTSGRVAATTLVAHEPERDLDVRYTVTFTLDTGLNVVVPVTMSEHYESRDREVTTGVATYTNFRRFQVDVRIRK